MIFLKDISKKKLEEFESLARGIMIVPSKVFYDFNSSLQKDSILQSAVIMGINAAKRTADMFPLCHALEISSIEIDITPSDNILRSSQIDKGEFLPSFKPKKFKFSPKKPAIASKIADENTNEIISISKLKEAKRRFNEKENAQIHHLTHAKKSANAKCGFITLVSVKTLSRIRPDIEALNALNAVNLSLINMLNTRQAEIIESRIDIGE